MKIRRVAQLCAAEVVKARGTKFPYLGLIASALMALVAKQQYSMNSRPENMTAMAYLTSSLIMASTYVIVIFSPAFAAMTVASEAARGTFRAILTRPVTRSEFLTAKFLVAATYLALLFAANLALASIIARDLPFISPSDRDLPIPQAGEQLLLLATGLALTFLPHLATASFAFCVSTLSANAATAVGVSIGLILTLEPLRYLLRIEDWLPTRYFDYALTLTQNKASGMYEAWGQQRTWMLLGVSGVTLAISLGIAYALFLRRDLND